MMETIDDNMDAMDWMVVSGRPIDLAKTFVQADAISVMLMAFPHLFPPNTNQWRPGAKRDPARDTFASPDLWTNYDDFYRQAAAASKLAYAASRSKQEADFRKNFEALRNACDSCHALYVKPDK
jgi:cytochrome c556